MYLGYCINNISLKKLIGHLSRKCDQIQYVIEKWKLLIGWNGCPFLGSNKSLTRGI